MYVIDHQCHEVLNIITDMFFVKKKNGEAGDASRLHELEDIIF